MPALLSSTSWIAATAVLAAGGWFAGPATQADAPSPRFDSIQLDYLGKSELPFNLTVDGTKVGGLSGISYDRTSHSYVAISDDRSALAPARFYSMDVPISAAGIGTVNVTAAHTLLQPDGTPFPATNLGAATPVAGPDPEAIAVNPRGGEIYWTSEGERITGTKPLLVDPWVRVSDDSGAYRGQLPIPDNMHFSTDTVGPRRNQTFEGLTFTPDGNHMFVSTEDPLFQDGTPPTASSGALTRITRYTKGQPDAQYAFALDQAFPDANPASDTTGISDVVALDSTHLLVLERLNVFSTLQWGARISLIDLTDATNVIDDAELPQNGLQLAKKSTVLDLSDVPGLHVDNFEGMTLGPNLPGGGRTLLLVSDNNFNDKQISELVAFKLD